MANKLHISLKKFKINLSGVLTFVGFALCLLMGFQVLNSGVPLSPTPANPLSIYQVDAVFLFIGSGICLVTSLLCVFGKENTSKIGILAIFNVVFLVFLIVNLVNGVKGYGPGADAIWADTEHYATDNLRRIAAERFQRYSSVQTVFTCLAIASWPFFVYFQFMKTLNGENDVWYSLSFAALLVFSYLACFNDINALDNIASLDGVFFGQWLSTRGLPISLIFMYVVSVKNDYNPDFDPSMAGALSH